MITYTIFLNILLLFNLEAALQTNGETKIHAKEVTEKQFENAPKGKDDGKTQMMQMIGLIRPMLP